MKEELDQLISISRFLGADKNYVIAGGGNTSVKDENTLFVKASGFALSTIHEGGFVALSREMLSDIHRKKYPDNPQVREEEVKNDLLRCRLFPAKNQRPSVEASLHDVIDYRFVVHLHPTFVNGVLCAVHGKKHIKEMFGNRALFVPYTDPGYILFKDVQEELEKWKNTYGSQPKIIFLENHGVFVGADTVDEIKTIYLEIRSEILRKSGGEPIIEKLPVEDRVSEIMPALRGILSSSGYKTLRIRNNTLIHSFVKDKTSFQSVELPFNPDGIVYCKARPLFLDLDGLEDSDRIDLVKRAIYTYRKNFGYDPKVIALKGLGLIASGDNSAAADIILDVFEDNMKIAWYSRHFGGPQFLSEEAVQFIDNWEVENFRRLVSKGQSGGRVENKVAIVTGGAQGFGLGIVKGLLAEGANVVIADINLQTGKEAVESLSPLLKKNDVTFIRVNITQAGEVKRLISETVKNFGGLDLLVCNAGVLRAGSLEELDERDFDFVTDVNYKGYFLCAKYGSVPMKIQYQANKALFSDIVQINSKSGLQGSNKNFAYAGSKFGAIGLTQSFALELTPWNIKVNAICPGNYFEGPLWSDPDNGLFAQYLRTGKVPGATSLNDVKVFYEQKVPMGRGCLPEDVVKAIIYIAEQQYETGQAIPVSGGQVMLK
ncbi:MAG: SDR family NAD(P)-dependent oxidoreductase [Cyclobacteriaceae bacterium]|nr:SDR family NAD(P)-dependent oxidoreductase [Cyclobacteriaceae bacterium]